VRKYFKSLLALVGLGMLATWSFNAQAVMLTCSGGGEDFQLGDAVQCQDGDDNNDPYPGDLTAFGVTWTAIDKDDQPGIVDGNDPDTGELESLFNWTADPGDEPLSGDWFLDSSLWDTFDRLVIVLKAGNGFATFELEVDDLSGEWITAQGLSHASLYGIIGDGTVPEPGTLGLLGLGLLGIGLARRRAR
jgi:PEP-CTERM motif